METNRAWNNGGRKMVAYLSRVLEATRSLPSRTTLYARTWPQVACETQEL